MAYVYICMSVQDMAFARHLHDLLQAEKFAVWMDADKVTPEAERWHTVERRIDECAAVILVMTPASYESEWVQRQLEHAGVLEKHIFPLLLEGESWPQFDADLVDEMRAGTAAALPDRLKLKLRKMVSTDRITVPLRPVGANFDSILDRMDAPRPNPAQWPVVAGIGALLLLVALVFLVSRL